MHISYELDKYIKHRMNSKSNPLSPVVWLFYTPHRPQRPEARIGFLILSFEKPRKSHNAYSSRNSRLRSTLASISKVYIIIRQCTTISGSNRRLRVSVSRAHVQLIIQMSANCEESMHEFGKT